MFAFQFFVGDPLTRTTVRGGIGVGNGYFFLERRLKGTSAPFFSLRLLIEGLDRAGIDGPISQRIRGGRRGGGRLLRRRCTGPHPCAASPLPLQPPALPPTYTPHTS